MMKLSTCSSVVWCYDQKWLNTILDVDYIVSCKNVCLVHCIVIILFIPITILGGTDEIMQNILHIQTGNCQSHKTLLWI